jgi:hypothetical protein
MDRGLGWKIHTPSIIKRGAVNLRIFLICSARWGLPAGSTPRLGVQKSHIQAPDRTQTVAASETLRVL